MDLQIFHVNFINIFEEIQRRRDFRLYYRMLRDTTNPFELPESRFIKLYRLPIRIVQEILIPSIEPYIRIGIRSTYVPLHIKVLATLHLLSQGSYQSSLGADSCIALAQSTVSKSINEIIEIIATHLFREYVKFPTDREEIASVKMGFEEKFNFPNVLGAIDCTHIAIQSPPINDPVQPALAYFNRKGYYSINVQTICDSNLKILAINARFPGATHDAAIWTNSEINRCLRRKFERGDHESWLLGDSGYPLMPYLMTPIPGADENTPEGRYNSVHITTRNTIERCFGVLKQRFRCLLKHRVLHYNHRTAGLIIYACSVLHNILVERNIEFDDDDNYEEEEEEDNEDDENQHEIDIPADVLVAGRRTRNRIIRYFENNFRI